ncbi:hypothetical protein niasHT_009178 [Heterodera trifolii]|uniref:Uncharacterized protein n=1 Tax=Heterodera trifolii TaxID=157864 RepID=A0ABD2ME54_9BILA
MKIIPSYFIVFFCALLLIVHFDETAYAEEQPKMAKANDPSEISHFDADDDGGSDPWRLDDPNREHLRDYILL